jgi:hypothetical protein
MERDRLIGVWKIIKYEFRLSDGISLRPFGEGVRGILMYHQNGQMALQIMEADRPRFAADDWLRGTDEEIKTAFEGGMAYWGTFEVDEIKHTVIHHIEGCSYPNWVGIDREQFFEIERDRLTLMTKPTTLAQEQTVGYLEWRKAS